MKAFVALFTLLSLPQIVSAATKIQTLDGIGLDGAPCAVEIERDGIELQNVRLSGAALIYEILAEKGSDYRPDERTTAGAAAQALGVLAEAPELFRRMERREHLFSEGETFEIDSSQYASEALPAVKMRTSIALKSSQGRLVAVDVKSIVRAIGLIKLASSEFACEAR